MIRPRAGSASRKRPEVESARALSRRVAAYNAANRPASALHSTAAKVYCTESALGVASEAIQILGGYGLSKEYPVEKMVRARMGLVGEENSALSLAAVDRLRRPLVNRDQTGLGPRTSGNACGPCVSWSLRPEA